MADFVAVLRKTVGALGNNTPEMREKVFDKARATIEAKLGAIDPPPPAAVVERQRKALEDAIATVRADYAEPPLPETSDDRDDALESVFAALDQSTAAVSPPPPTPAPTRQMPPSMPDGPKVAKPAADTFDTLAGERLAGDGAPARPLGPAASGNRRRTGLVAALVILLLAAAAGGYVWWSNRADTPPVAQAPGESSQTQEEAAATAGDLTAAPEPEPEPDETPPADTSPAEQTTLAEPETPAAPDATAGPEKFTQRLLPDGSEVDEGSAGSEPGIGEGSSVATAVQPPAAPETVPAATSEQEQPEAAPPAGQAAEAAGSTADAASDPGPAAVTVGQRAIFYEERTSTAEGSAEMGSIAWSLVQESPGGELPPEPAIRAEATIPGKDVQLRMTIRRNGDQTLPASHIVEMIFLTPDGFEGGAVSSVSRIAFKETEQAPGSPLVGIPAKIADGFFLIALSDAPAETQANLNLLRRQSWIDIPIVYQSGQRALLSLEKGIPGDRVFQDALRAWSEADSG